MGDYLKGADGKFLGRKRSPKKAPKPQHHGRHARNNKTEDNTPTTKRSNSNSPTNATMLETLSAAWEQHHTNLDTRVRPQKIVVSTNTLKEGRELIGNTHTHVQAQYTVHAEHHLVSQKLLQAGYACSIPMPRATYATQTPKAPLGAGSTDNGVDTGVNRNAAREGRPAGNNPANNKVNSAPSASSDLAGNKSNHSGSTENQNLAEQVQHRGIWELKPHPQDPHATIVTTPHVTNNNDGWAYLETGLRHATGPRFLRPKTNIFLVGTTPPAPPMPPPAGYAPITGLKRLIYSA